MKTFRVYLQEMPRACEWDQTTREATDYGARLVRVGRPLIEAEDSFAALKTAQAGHAPLIARRMMVEEVRT